MSARFGLGPIASALGAGVVAVLMLSLPPAALANGGGDGDHKVAGVPRDGRSQAPPVDVRRLLNDIDTPIARSSRPQPAPRAHIVLVDDDSLEPTQIAVALTVGATLGAGGMLVWRVRRRLPRGSADPAPAAH